MFTCAFLYVVMPLYLDLEILTGFVIERSCKNVVKSEKILLTVLFIMNNSVELTAAFFNDD